MAERRCQLGGIFVGDFGDGAKEQREADGEDALFAARKNASAEVEGGQTGFLDGIGAEVVRHESDFFVLFGGGGDGFAELGEAQHGGRTVSHAGSLRLPEGGYSHKMTAIETIQ